MILVLITSFTGCREDERILIAKYKKIIILIDFFIDLSVPETLYISPPCLRVFFPSSDSKQLE
jgi:hypothetical protein